MKRALRVSGLALGILLSLHATAKEGDTFRPFVSYAHYLDSNLFRLAESEYSLVPERSDQYSVLSAGLNVDWKPGRQQILASISKSRVRYSRNTQLDNDGSDNSLSWNRRNCFVTCFRLHPPALTSGSPPASSISANYPSRRYRVGYCVSSAPYSC